MKCTQCKKEIKETFLGKIKGTYIKKQPICSECQKDLSFNTKETSAKENS